MTQALLFKTLVTRSNRYRERYFLMQALNNPSYTVNVSGCFVSQTSSYVDIELNEQELPVKLFEISAIKFTNTDYTDYIAFVDRIEPNNFNTAGSTLYYRLYVTIDWWSTIMLNDNQGEEIDNICHRLEGVVDRAHVNDCEKYEDNNFHKTLRFTSKAPEVVTFKTKNDYYGYISESHSKKFLWILRNKAVKGDIDGVKVGVREVPYQYNVYIFPLQQMDLYGSVIGEDNQLIGEVGTSDYSIPSCIDDSTAISIYLTDYCPYYNPIDNTIVIPFDSQEARTAYQRTKFSLLGDLEGYAFSIAETSFLKMLFSKKVNDLLPTDLSEERLKTFYRNIVAIPNTYQEYLTTIAKIDYSPYTLTYLSVDGVVEEIKTELITSNVVFEYGVTPSEGGIYARFSYGLYEDINAPSNYLIITANNSFPPMSINDQFTASTRLSNTIKQVGGYFTFAADVGKSAVQFGSGDFISGTISAAKAVGSGANAVANYYAIEAQNKKLTLLGENGYRVSGSNLIQYYTPNVVSVYSPIESDRQIILKDLALYGYNTYLHPHDVLEYHGRKYFNYLKTQGAQINLPNYPTDVKLAIEEMFNNGVWLWRNNEYFMNFEVPNYPIIMEE